MCFGHLIENLHSFIDFGWIGNRQFNATDGVLNQMTETHRVRDLAKIVSKLTGATIENVANPRIEAAENDLHVENRTLLELGLKPTTLSDGLMEEITGVAKKYLANCDASKIPCQSLWRHPVSDNGDLSSPEPKLKTDAFAK